MQGFIFLETSQQLNEPVFEYRLWKATCEIPLSRRKLLDDVAITIYDYKGRILYKKNDKIFIWPKPDIYEVFGGVEARWISTYRQTVDGRPRRKSHPSILERRRIFSLYFHIKHPQIWVSFKR